jgi:hypothetical protein
MHPAPRHTGRRSSSSNPAARRSRARRGGHWLDHRSGRGDADYDPDAGHAGSAARVRAAAQRTGRVARRLIEGFLGKASLVPNSLLRGIGRCVDGRQQLPAVRFSQASADTDLMPVASHRAASGLHAVLRQFRSGPA